MNGGNGALCANVQRPIANTSVSNCRLKKPTMLFASRLWEQVAGEPSSKFAIVRTARVASADADNFDGITNHSPMSEKFQAGSRTETSHGCDLEHRGRRYLLFPRG